MLRRPHPRTHSRTLPAIGIILAIGTGLLITHTVAAGSPTLMAVGLKLFGHGNDCPWPRVLSYQRDWARRAQLQEAALKELSVTSHDPALDIQLISSPRRSYWIKRQGDKLSGRELLADLLADHAWMGEQNPQNMVRPGDVVLDCGAHVGVFTQSALERGAAQVVAIEPDPVNRECLTRNFATEIAQGKVILVPKGVWSSESTMTLFISVENSGMNSLRNHSQGGSIEVPVTTIDNLVASLQLARVDFIKMDIEGAEREALRGALSTLRRFRPRLMIDSYHRPDDMQVLPGIIREAHSGYALTCGPCETAPGRFPPHVAFYQ